MQNYPLFERNTQSSRMMTTKTSECRTLPTFATFFLVFKNILNFGTFLVFKKPSRYYKVNNLAVLSVCNESTFKLLPEHVVFRLM